MSKTRKKTSVVIADGCRIPFQQPGTGYRHFRAHDLARFALRGLLDRTGIDPGRVDQVVLGNVIQDPETSNVAREAALGAGLPATVPAHTVSMSSLSSNRAIIDGAEAILSGRADAVIAGGTESVSTYLDSHPRDKRRGLPFAREYSTGEVMGEHADRMASLFDVDREAQDAYTVRSHQSAVRAGNQGWTSREIVPVTGPPDFVPIEHDNLVRADCTPENLAVQKPVFDPKFGTVTAVNASPHADGAAAVLLMRESVAEELGILPLARLVSWSWTAADPGESMLLGQGYAIPALLAQTRIREADIDVFELHEAFAAQVLAVLKALALDTLPATGSAGSPTGSAGSPANSTGSPANSTGSPANSTRPSAGSQRSADGSVSIPLRKINTQGGSLALGEAFGATGARLVTTAVHRLKHEQGTLALVASAGVGGLGHALLLESPERPASGNKSASRKSSTGRKKSSSGKSASTSSTSTTKTSSTGKSQTKSRTK
ncbi:MAG: thiolase family protein [Cyclonatronaceae bacterium]